MKRIFSYLSYEVLKTPHHKLCLQVSKVPSALTIIFCFFLNINTKIWCIRHLIHHRVAVCIPRSFRHSKASVLLSHPHRGRNCEMGSQADENSGCVNVIHSARRPARFKLKFSHISHILATSDNINLSDS